MKTCRDCIHVDSGIFSSKCKKTGDSISLDKDAYSCKYFDRVKSGLFDHTCRECVYMEEKFFGGAPCLKGIFGKGPDSQTCRHLKKRSFW